MTQESSNREQSSERGTRVHTRRWVCNQGSGYDRIVGYGEGVTGRHSEHEVPQRTKQHPDSLLLILWKNYPVPALQWCNIIDVRPTYSEVLIHRWGQRGLSKELLACSSFIAPTDTFTAPNLDTEMKQKNYGFAFVSKKPINTLPTINDDSESLQATSTSMTR